MPYTLTRQEKEELKQKYIETTRILNSVLPDDDKIELDLKGFSKKLENPDIVYAYKKSLETQLREQKKKLIGNELLNKFEHMKIPGKPYVLDREVYNDLIPSDDPEAMAYNEAKIKQYYLHPEAVMQSRYQKLLSTNFGDVDKFSRCDDVENFKVAYAGKNAAIVEDACTAYNALCKEGVKEKLTPEAREHLTSVIKNYEAFMDINEKSTNFTTTSFFLPESLTDEQRECLSGNATIMAEYPELDRHLAKYISQFSYIEQSNSEFVNFFKQLKEKGVDLSEDGALNKYCGVVIENGEPNYISLPNWLTVHNYVGNPSLAVLSKEESESITNIFTKDYTKEEGFKEIEFPEKFKEPLSKRARDEFVYQYAINNNKKISEVENASLGEIASKISGGWSERAFKTTSLEYKNLVQAMKDYENPNHVNEGKTRPVKFAANQYLIHKGVKTREEAMNLPSPSKDRALLCLDLIDSFQKAEGPNEAKMVPGTKEVIEPKKEAPGREPAIDDPDLLNDNLAPVEHDEQLEELDLQEELVNENEANVLH